MIYGYKVCFTRKLCQNNNPIDNKFFDFRACGHFDGFFVRKIESISQLNDLRENYGEFHKTVKNFYHLEKQMLNLFSFQNSHKESNIFDINEYSDKPIVVVTIVNNYDLENIERQIEYAEKSIQNYINESKNDVSFEIFQTTSIEDYVIVFRSNRLTSITECIASLRKNDNPEQTYKNQKRFSAVNLYSIIALDCRKDDFSSKCKHENIFINLKLYVNPTANFEGIVTDVKKIITNSKHELEISNDKCIIINHSFVKKRTKSDERTNFIITCKYSFSIAVIMNDSYFLFSIK